MIISHSKKFIFIKNKRVSSTHMEQILFPYLSSEDVIAPIFGYHSYIKLGKSNYIKRYSSYPINSHKKNSFNANLKYFFGKLIGKKYLPFNVIYDNHEPLKNVLYSNKNLDYFIFSQIRNPFDQLISHYKWAITNNLIDPNIVFLEKFIYDNYKNFFNSVLSILSSNNSAKKINFFIRYEFLKKDLRFIEEKLNLKNLSNNYFASKTYKSKESLIYQIDSDSLKLEIKDFLSGTIYDQLYF